nr:FHA domain-containing protein [Lientehia hominis]
MLSPTLFCQESQEAVPLTHFPFLIGTQENWVHYNPGFHGVSRLHLRLEKKDGMYWIMDLNSTNGTKLNGSPLLPNEEKRIRHGDHIWIAGLTYEFMEFDRKEKSC